MAFVADDPAANPTTEDPNKQNGPPGPPTLGSGGGGGLFGSGPPGGGASAGAAGGAAAAPPKSNESGSWTNLNSYLNANQDQAAPMAQNVTGGVANEAQGAQSSLNNDYSGYTSSVDKATAKADPDLFNAVATDPTKLSSDQQQQFENDVGASYTAPATFAPSDSTEAQYNAAGQDVTNAGSAAGQQTLLQKVYGGGNQTYNQGEQNLDQMLLGSSADSQNAFKDLNSQWSGIGNDLSSAEQAASDYSTAAQNTTAATKTQAQAVLDQDAQNLNQQVQAGIPAALQNQSQTLASIDSALQQGYIPTQYQSQLGYLAGKDLYGLDPTQFVTANSQGPTAQTIETSDQAAELNALNTLANGQQIADLNGTSGVDASLSAYNPANAWNPYTIANNTAIDTAIGQQKDNLISSLQNYEANPGLPGGAYGGAQNTADVQADTAKAIAALQGGASVNQAWADASGGWADAQNPDFQGIAGIMSGYGLNPEGVTGATGIGTNATDPSLIVSDTAPAQPTRTIDNPGSGSGVGQSGSGDVSTSNNGVPTAATWNPNPTPAPAPAAPATPAPTRTITLPGYVAGSTPTGGTPFTLTNNAIRGGGGA